MSEHPYPNGTRVVIIAPYLSGTGTVCDIQTSNPDGTPLADPAYHILMDWPQMFRVIACDHVRRFGEGMKP